MIRLNDGNYSVGLFIWHSKLLRLEPSPLTAQVVSFFKIVTGFVKLILNCNTQQAYPGRSS
jgi:hypothetical protein